MDQARTRTRAPLTRSCARRRCSCHRVVDTRSPSRIQLVGLFRQPHAQGPHPTVLLIPGLDSTKEEFRDVERTFHDRGMATFALDGPGQGEAEWTLPIRPEWEVVGETVISYLQSMPDVDAERIGVWGVSLGGFYAARLASSGLPVKGDGRARRSV
jgi:dienelactone hydrolase